MEIKIFKANIGKTFDTDKIEREVNSFMSEKIVGDKLIFKNIIDIKQSAIYDDKNDQYLLIITVLYEIKGTSEII